MYICKYIHIHIYMSIYILTRQTRRTQSHSAPTPLKRPMLTIVGQRNPRSDGVACRVCHVSPGGVRRAATGRRAYRRGRRGASPPHKKKFTF